MRLGWNSIRSKIFLGCISLTLVTILTSAVSQHAELRLSQTALSMYDNAFISMSNLRSAQSIVLGVSRDIGVGEVNKAVFADQLQSALDALDVARERAMSPRGDMAAKQVQAALSGLQAEIRDARDLPSRQEFVGAEQRLDMAVQIYAGDGFRLRRSVEALVMRTRFNTFMGVLGSIVAALLITLTLSRAIVPSIRHAVGVAMAIAAGHLDNKIDQKGSAETGMLLRALATMQNSIAEKIAFIETLMERQASSHAAEIADQHARLQAALNNMTLGLCIFGADRTLLVHNKRFVDMFAPNCDESDVDAAELLTSLSLIQSGNSHDSDSGSRSFSRLLEDGRTIAISEEPMEGGGRVVTYEDITERHRIETQLSYMARHDALTGLPNRVLFREHVERGLTRVRHGDVLSVLYIDLDHFKMVNDTLGHPVGDLLLRDAATRMIESAQESEVLARLGGDEFAVMHFADHDGDASRLLAARLIDILSHPFEIEGHHISIGASIGIALTANIADTPDTLLKNADLALYLAKAEGRGTYRFFAHELEVQIHEKRRLEIDLRTAIAENDFQIYYQPLINSHTGHIVTFEALLRWPHAERGFVRPTEFIPLAEELGLIPELGHWVLHQACQDAMTWPKDIKVAVNLSPLQFRRPGLVGQVKGALDLSGLQANRLELEITESLMLQDSDLTLATLHDLRRLGVSISMDDFGKGYSSLSYLRRFPFDKIKIDQDFVQNIEADACGLSIVRAVIELGRALRMSVVAEGVETSAQMDLLIKAGCQELQGYLFSQPQPVSAVAELIQQFSTANRAMWAPELITLRAS